MNDETLVLSGQVLALSTVLTKCICEMPQDAALRVLLALEIERQGLRKDDLDDEVDPIASKARDVILAGYIGLLKSVSSLNE